MLTRREALTTLAWLGAGATGLPALAACAPVSGTSKSSTALATAGLAASDVARHGGSATARPDAVRSIQALTGDLYRRLAADPGNLVCSPYSVALALGMTRNGARGRTATEMGQVLAAPSLSAFNAGVNSLAQLLEERAGRKRRADKTSGTVSLDGASSLWGQRGTRWNHAFLDTLARDYGAAMHLVDYSSDPAAAGRLINDWTAAKTDGKIAELIPPGVLDPLTRLVLVNAIYLKAPWEEPFTPSSTSRRPFQRADGSRVDVNMMSQHLSLAGFASGPGWRAGRLTYLGGELAMAVVVPDPGRLESVEASLDGPGLARLLTSFKPAGTLSMQLPRWSFRLAFDLEEQLTGLGMPTAFDPTRADFSAMTTQEHLYISKVLHQAFIAVDEQGTEAAAATAVVISTLSAPARPVVLTADRPFLFIVFDVETTTPLFMGRVSDPSAS